MYASLLRSSPINKIVIRRNTVINIEIRLVAYEGILITLSSAFCYWKLLSEMTFTCINIALVLTVNYVMFYSLIVKIAYNLALQFKHYTRYRTISVPCR
jgi:hypothetical protein